MRTPGDDGDLTLGFLYGEGLIASAGDVGSVAHCGRPGEEGYGNVIDVHSAAGTQTDATTASCRPRKRGADLCSPTIAAS